MKIFKKLATFFLCAMLTLGVGAFTACGGDKENNNSTSESTQTAGVYVITVLDASGAPVAGAQVQLCAYVNGVSGELGMCYAPMATDANGQVSYNKTPSAAIYEIHVINQELDQIYTTPATYGEVTVKLK